jgi:hypothetical protein
MLSIPRRTRNLIITVILILAAVYGVARLAVWYTVKDGLDSAQESIAPFASMEYSNIHSPVFGAFGASGIRIKPHMFQDEIAIGSVLVHIEDPVEKYQFLNARMNDSIPTSFSFSLNGARVPLTASVAALLDANTAMAGLPPDSAAACKAGTGFTVADLKKMGYEELVANITADYAYARRGSGLSVYLRLHVSDMMEMTLEGRIPPSDVVFAVDRISGIPRLSDLTVTMRDLSWSPRFNRYCAGMLGITEAEYVEKRVNDTRLIFAQTGFELSEELLAGLKDFASGNVSMTLSLNPHDPFDPTQVDLMADPEYAIDALGMEVMFDGKPVQSLGAVRAVAAEEPEAAPKQVMETYKPTGLDELPQYLKSQVRIVTADDKVHEGYLDSIDANRIVLTRHLVGGSATFDVGREQVERVLVLRP